MSTFLYTRPTERVGGVLAVETGTEDTGYPAGNLDNGLPHQPARLVEPDGAWVRDLGAAKQVDFCALIHHNFSEAADVRLQGNATNAWTAPTVDVPFTVLQPHADGFSVNLWVDLSAVVPIPLERTLQFWRLVVTDNEAPVALGEWAMYGALRSLGVRNISWGSRRRVRRPSIVHETELLVRRSYDLGVSLRGVDVDVEPTDTYRNDIEQWFRSAHGEVEPFVIVPHREQDDAWFVTFMAPDLEWTRERRNYNTLGLMFQEVSRGLVL